MLAVAESLGERGELDLDDLRQRDLGDPNAAGLLVRVLPFGLASPLDRPRLRRDAYRCAAAAGADEGTAVACVAAALIAADLMRFDASTTALRVRQSLLEDAPMALLDRLRVLPENSDLSPSGQPGATLQLALSVVDWTHDGGVSGSLARLGEEGRGDVGTLAAAFAGAASGRCDIPLDDEVSARIAAAATALAKVEAAAV